MKTRLLGVAAAIVGASVLLVRKQPRQANSVSPPRKADVRRAVVEAALAELGGPREPSRYWLEVYNGVPPYPPHWCGGFALWCLHQAGLGHRYRWEPSRGFASQLPITRDPQPGDVAYFTRLQHHAIVKHRNTDGTVTTIDGNQEGQSVRERTRPFTDAAAYYSIEPLLEFPNS